MYYFDFIWKRVEFKKLKSMSGNLIKKGLMAILFFSNITYSASVIMGTRVVYPSNTNDVMIEIRNDSEEPSLIQAWIDDGDPKALPEQISVPFVLTPPISKINPKNSQFLRIMALPAAKQLKKSEESIFWLNVVDIPPKPKHSAGSQQNYMQISIRSRIKLFYRPSSISDDALHAAKKLKWMHRGEHLLVKNPTPFYISIPSVFQQDGHRMLDLVSSDGLFLKPHSEQKLSLQSTNMSNMRFISINEYGAKDEILIRIE